MSSADKLNASSGSSFVFDGTTYPVINLKYDPKLDNTDVTDSDTAPGFKDSLDGRGEYAFTFDGYKSKTVPDIPLGSTKVAIINMGTARYVGSASLQALGVDADINTGVVKVNYSGKFQGAVSSSL